MKSLAFIFTLIVVSAVIVNGQQKGSRAAADKQKPDAIQQDFHTSPSIVVIRDEHSDDNRDGSKKNSETYFGRFASPENLPNIFLVVVAALTAFYVAQQAKESAKATEAMQGSVEITVAQNRPWLLPHIQEGKDRIQEPYLKPVGSVPEKELRFSHCVFFFKNYGKTPAKALMLRAEMRIGENPAEPPASDIYEVDRKNFNTFIFPQEESVPHHATLIPSGFISQEDLNAVNEGTRFLWLQGIVKYRDSVEAESIKNIPGYETRFCYLWETRLNSPTPFWQLAGPKGTNEAS